MLQEQASTLEEYVRKVNSIALSWTAGNPDAAVWYRGHRNERSKMWQLVPVAYRDVPWNTMTDQDEASFYCDFRLQASHLHSYQLDYLDDWAWLATMRHHNAPTRLMDWTELPLVALYFALGERPPVGDDPAVPATIWLIDAIAFNRHFHHEAVLFFPKRCEELKRDQRHNVVPSEFCYSYLPGNLGRRCTKSTANPICIALPKTNPRLVAQHGFFTVHGSSRMSLDDVARTAKFQRIATITVPGRHIAQMRETMYLWISETDVFPELDSVSKRLMREYRLALPSTQHRPRVIKKVMARTAKAKMARD